jgi:hypothetical protein
MISESKAIAKKELKIFTEIKEKSAGGDGVFGSTL